MAMALFPAQVTYATGAPTRLYSGGGDHPSSVTVGDFDGDGSPDSRRRNMESEYGECVSQHWRWHVSPTGDVPCGRRSYAVGVGDFDGDGHSDLAVANNAGTVSVLLNLGDGTFAPQQDLGNGINPQSLAVGDLKSRWPSPISLLGIPVTARSECFFSQCQ